MKPLFFISLIILFSACKKDNTPASPVPSCKIATVTRLWKSTKMIYTLSYDDSGRISQVVCEGSDAFIKTFTYSGDTIFVNVPEGVHASSAVITLNSFKFISTRKVTFNQSVSDAAYNYDANRQIISITAKQAATLTYTITNGDIINTTVKGISDTSTYFTDKASVPGNLDDFSQLINYGAFYHINKHLKKTYQSGSDKVDYSYSFDSDGKITSVIANYGTDTDTFSFTYTCQ